MSFSRKVNIMLWIITFTAASIAIYINIGPGIGK
jgi:hypothetical protein